MIRPIYRPGRRALCRALSAVLRNRLTFADAIITHRVPPRQVRELWRLVRKGRMPW